MLIRNRHLVPPVAALFVSLVGFVAPASAKAAPGADGRPRPPAQVTDDGALITVSTGRPGGGGGPGTGPAAPSPWTNCRQGDVSILPGLVAIFGSTRPFVDVGPELGEVEELNDRPESDFVGVTTFTICDRVDGSGPVGWLNRPGVPVDPTPGLIIEAERILTLPVPVIATSPPRGSTQPVGMPVWFWSTNSSTQSQSASVPGITVTVTATAESMELVIDEPTSRAAGASRSRTVTCEGTGTPYDPERHEPWDRSECSHTFDWPGEATVSATVTWRLTWQSSAGASGTLDPVTRTSTLTLDPTELQAVLD